MKHGNSESGKLPVFRERLRTLQGDLTTTAFAEKLGLSRQTIGFYINGDRIPDIQTLRQICEKCNVSADFLLGLSDVKTPDVAAQSAIEYTGLSEDNVDFLHWIRRGMQNHLYVGQENGQYTIDGNMPYMDCLNDLIEITRRKEVIKYYIALRQSNNKSFENPHNYYDIPSILGDYEWQDGNVCEYACIKVAMEVGKALLEKYRRDNKRTGLVYDSY